MGSAAASVAAALGCGRDGGWGTARDVYLCERAVGDVETLRFVACMTRAMRYRLAHGEIRRGWGGLIAWRPFALS